MIIVIKKLNVPKVILRKILMLLNLDDIKNVILNVKEMNVLDNYYKSFLSKAKLGFLYNCREGNLKEAQWLISVGSVDHHDDESAFIGSCANEHLEVAQWIFSLGGVDHHIMNERVFVCACMYGHLEVAQWIFSLGGVNYHSGNEQAFKIACLYGYLEVAKWIFSLGGVKIEKIDEFLLKINSQKIIEWINTIKDFL